MAAIVKRCAKLTSCAAFISFSDKFSSDFKKVATLSSEQSASHLLIINSPSHSFEKREHKNEISLHFSSNLKNALPIKSTCTSSDVEPNSLNLLKMSRKSSGIFNNAS